MKCIDPWLTKNKRNCPVCKRKVLPGDETSSSEEESDDDGDATEHTPLLTAQSGAQVHRGRNLLSWCMIGNFRNGVTSPGLAT